jgi:hypothetical protein
MKVFFKFRVAPTGIHVKDLTWSRRWQYFCHDEMGQIDIRLKFHKFGGLR